MELMELSIARRCGLLWSGEFHQPLALSPSLPPTFAIRSTLKESAVFAYVSVLSTEGFVPGVLVLWESLKRTNPRYEFYLLVTQGVSAECEHGLRSLGLNVLRDDSDVLSSSELVDVDHRWRHTFDKIKIFRLLDFEKIVYLDADMYVCRNIDALFDKPHFSAVENRGNQDWLDGRRYFNSGLMVVEPRVDDFHAITALIEPTIRRCLDAGIACGDQNVLNMYVADWPNHDELHLEDGYNVFWGSLDRHLSQSNFTLRDEGVGRRGVSVVHFTGKSKPWVKKTEYRLKVWLRPLRNRRFPSVQSIRLLREYYKLLDLFKRESCGCK